MTTRTDPLLTTEQVAALLNVAPSTVRGLVKRDGLRARVVGRQLRFVRTDLDEYLERSTRPAGPVATT